MTPANPETYVVTRAPGSSEGFTREPVIGYVYDLKADQPPTVVTIEGQRRLLGESAVLFSCGVVVDPLNSVTFADTEEWLAFTPKKRAATSVKTTKPTDPDDDGGDTDSDAVNEDGYDIEWTNKSFKNNSFWHYDDGSYEFCFILPGDENAPKATEKLTKIKRTEMDALKKSIDVLDLDAVKNPDVLPDADPEESDDDDDEDDDGLI